MKYLMNQYQIVKNKEFNYFQRNNHKNTNNQYLENFNNDNFTINSTADYKYKKQLYYLII